jgi:hypothetical protein
MTNRELIEEHYISTMYCSFAHHMRDISPTYQEIIDKGEEIVPDILEYLREEDGGMSIMLLLMDITKESPYEPEKIGGFDAYNVKSAKELWIEWGIKKGLMK